MGDDVLRNRDSAGLDLALKFNALSMRMTSSAVPNLAGAEAEVRASGSPWAEADGSTSVKTGA